MRRHHLSNKCKLSKRRATYNRRDQRRNNRKTSNNVERACACLGTSFTAYARRNTLHVFPAAPSQLICAAFTKRSVAGYIRINTQGRPKK
jgi:hypothetical protein